MATKGISYLLSDTYEVNAVDVNLDNVILCDIIMMMQCTWFYLTNYFILLSGFIYFFFLIRVTQEKIINMLVCIQYQEMRTFNIHVVYMIVMFCFHVITFWCMCMYNFNVFICIIGMHAHIICSSFRLLSDDGFVMFV